MYVVCGVCGGGEGPIHDADSNGVGGGRDAAMVVVVIVVVVIVRARAGMNELEKG